MTPRDAANDRKLYKSLIKFANAVCRNQTIAQDIVQEAVTRLLEHEANFPPTSTLNDYRRWCFTVLRNYHITTNMRKVKRESTVDVEDVLPYQVVRESQSSHMDALDVKNAIATLTPNHQLVLCHIATGGSYDDCPDMVEGTVKSRLHRARNKLKAALNAHA